MKRGEAKRRDSAMFGLIFALTLAMSITLGTEQQQQHQYHYDKSFDIQIPFLVDVRSSGSLPADFSQTMKDILPSHSVNSKRVWKETTYLPWVELDMKYEFDVLGEDFIHNYKQMLETNGKRGEDDVLVITVQDMISFIDETFANEFDASPRFFALQMLIISPSSASLLPAHTILPSEGECTQSILAKAMFLDLTAKHCDLSDRILHEPHYIRKTHMALLQSLLSLSKGDITGINEEKLINSLMANVISSAAESFSMISLGSAFEWKDGFATDHIFAPIIVINNDPLVIPEDENGNTDSKARQTTTNHFSLHANVGFVEEWVEENLLLGSQVFSFSMLEHHLDEHPQLAVALQTATKWFHATPKANGGQSSMSNRPVGNKIDLDGIACLRHAVGDKVQFIDSNVLYEELEGVKDVLVDNLLSKNKNLNHLSMLMQLSSNIDDVESINYQQRPYSVFRPKSDHSFGMRKPYSILPIFIIKNFVTTLPPKGCYPVLVADAKSESNPKQASSSMMDVEHEQVVQAARNGNQHTLQMILAQLGIVDFKTVANMVDKNLWTSLFEAVRGESLRAVQFLIKHGADVDIRSSEGQTPLDLALELFPASHEIVTYLEEALSILRSPITLQPLFDTDSRVVIRDKSIIILYNDRSSEDGDKGKNEDGGSHYAYSRQGHQWIRYRSTRDAELESNQVNNKVGGPQASPSIESLLVETIAEALVGLKAPHLSRGSGSGRDGEHRDKSGELHVSEDLSDRFYDDRLDRVDLTWAHGAHPFPPFGEDLRTVVNRRTPGSKSSVKVMTALSQRHIIICRAMVAFWNIQDFSFRFNYLLLKSSEMLTSANSAGVGAGGKDAKDRRMHYATVNLNQSEAITLLADNFQKLNCKENLRRIQEHLHSMKVKQMEIGRVFGRDEEQGQDKRKELQLLIYQLELSMPDVNIAFDNMERCIEGHFAECSVVEVTHYQDFNINNNDARINGRDSKGPKRKWTMLGKMSFIIGSIVALGIFAVVLKVVQHSIEKKAKKLK